MAIHRTNGSWIEDIKQVVRGLLMGGADIIPGVSGGTVALILGIYQRLITAISHVDFALLKLLRRRKWSDAAAHIDLRFLIFLGLGIGIGILSLASLMNRLLTHDDTRSFTLAAFFGLILASTILVARMAARSRASIAATTIILAPGGALFAFWLTGLTGINGNTSYGYLFLCGAVAICAMILPGISGAFILLILGMYVHVTGLVKQIATFDLTMDVAMGVIVFCAGCAVGLIFFSKILRWLLSRFMPATMELLAGFMLGSLRKIWPFQTDVTLERLERTGLSADKIAQIEADPATVAELGLKHRVFENALPEKLFATETTQVILIVAAAFVLVFVLDWITLGKGRPGKRAQTTEK